jgi:hypothetical protein
VTAEYSDLTTVRGVPYFNIRVAHAFYHINVLAVRLSEADLTDAAERQMTANQLPVCLVLAKDRAEYYRPESAARRTHPRGRSGYLDRSDRHERGVPDTGRPAGRPDKSKTQRHSFRGSQQGGRRATEHEKRHLTGVLSDGTPLGLSRCDSRRDWKGVCLGPSEEFAGLVMAVYCYGDNHNRCARCNESLYERKLNANDYNPRNRTVWHVSGCCSVRHRCWTGEFSASWHITRTTQSDR